MTGLRLTSKEKIQFEFAYLLLNEVKLNLKPNLFCYICCIMPKRVTSQLDPSPRDSSSKQHSFFEEMSQRWRAVSNSVHPIWPVWDYIIRPPAPDTKTLPLDLQASVLILI